MANSFEKTNLIEDPFALGMEIYWDKIKGVLGLSQKHTKESILKRHSMQASKLTPVLMSRVIVLEFSVFQEPT